MILQSLLSGALKLLWGLGGLVAIGYLALCLVLWVQQRRMMFFPTRLIETTPAALNLAYEDVWLSVQTNGKVERVHGWWLPAAGAEQGAVLHLHGNAYNVGANLEPALKFHQLGFSVLMVDYRGYGWSDGKFPTEKRFYEDAETAWNYLVQTRCIDPSRIFLFGHSLGGAIAIHLALHHSEAAGLIVESSFTSMRAMVDRMGPYWMFPIDLLLTQHFPSLQRVRSLLLPVLYLHGTADSLVPYQMSEALFAASPEPKFLSLFAGADHNNVAESGGDEYLQVLAQFMSRPLREVQRSRNAH